jgi:hypothetical protein
MFAASKTASVSGGYQISRSLRFNSADTAYLNRTPASATNRQTWTWSGWVKRSALGAYSTIFGHCSSDGLQQHTAWFRNDDTLQFYIYSSGYNLNLITTQVFRDVSAWYHIVIAQDTTQATDTNRAKIYVNGVQVTAFSTAAYPTQNTNGFINSNVAHGIGSFPPALGSYFNGYQTEINLIDGQALTPSSFGETNAQTGVWQPKGYAGSYGTNGFYLNFSDNSNTTAATLGADSSANGNNWTPNNFSVTAGVGNDSLVDSPTSYGGDSGAGGTVRGNYATLNAVSTAITLSNGNLAFTSGATNTSSYSTIGMSSGKWYAEVTWSTAGSTSILGVALQGYDDNSTFPGNKLYSYGYDKDGLKYNNNTGVAYGATFTSGDIISIALDVDAGTITYYKNGSTQGTAFTGLPSGTYFIGVGLSSSTGDINFGQRPFAYTAPSGFKALCTQNLPTPTIGATTATQAGKFFNPVLWTGTGSSLGVTGVGFQPDLVWAKGRSGATEHAWYDAVRGVQKQLESNNTDAETTETTGLTAFGVDGFTTGALAQMNTSAATYVAWNWKANGSGSSNTAGQITSTVSANTTSGFSIVTFTTDGTTKTVGHGLGVAPKMIIVKQRNSTSPWYVFTTAIDGTYDYLVLNTTDAASNSSYTAPTATVFEYNDDNAATQVAYCFAEIAGYSKFGSYTGNGSSDGPFVFTGMRPAYVMIRVSSAASQWLVFDAARNTANAEDNILYPNTSGAEDKGVGTSPLGVDFLSNGFKIRTTDAWANPTGGTVIFAAFATAPFKYSLAR